MKRLPFSQPSKPDSDQSFTAPDLAFQRQMLRGVSRTFALTIPLLPHPLSGVVGNAYLLCRIADTVEDEPGLDLSCKEYFAQRFLAVVRDGGDPGSFARDLMPHLSTATSPEEKQLIDRIPRVIGITRSLDSRPRQAIERCLRIMLEGMIYFQSRRGGNGLPRLEDLNHYCYVVAGVVGEMLTDLFCHFSPRTAANYDQMMALATSFGQGLQMTNILKDIWSDVRLGKCWFPRDIFLREGFDLGDLRRKPPGAGFEAGLKKMVGLAHAHLRNALRYSLLISPRDKGIRRFCLLALGLAVLTIRKIHADGGYRSGEEIKISRNSVRYTYLATRFAASEDWLLKELFRWIGAGLPMAAFSPEEKPI